MRMGADQQFCLRWNNFHTNITTAFESLRDDEDFVDITLACEGRQVKAHKMVLSACSPYFRNLLRGNPCQHPIVFLKDVTFANLASILDFMYHGEVNVSHNELATFLKTAEALKVRGLAEDDKKKDSENCTDATSPGPSKEPPDPGSPRLDDGHNETSQGNSSPPSKRRRRRSAESADEASEAAVLNDIRETSVKNEPQDFADESDMLGHGTGALESNNIKLDNSGCDEAEDRLSYGLSDSVTISRNQAAMQQLQDSFNTFLPSMTQPSSYLSHASSDIQRSSYSMEGVQGLPPGMSNLPGPSMTQAGASQDTSQEVSTSLESSRANFEDPDLEEVSCVADSTFSVAPRHVRWGEAGGGSAVRSLLGAPRSPSIRGHSPSSGPAKRGSSLVGAGPHSASTGFEVQCSVCGRILCNKYVLKVHMRDLHSQRKTLMCRFCGRSYSSINSLRVHISQTHKDLSNVTY